MKATLKYVFPAFFGVLIYASIRVVDDTMTETLFWQRSLRQNAIEVVSVIGMAYGFDVMLRYLVNYFNRRLTSVHLNDMLLEYGTVCLACLVFINPVLALIHYLVNDPLRWDDVALTNVVVVLYSLLYYAIARGRRLIDSYIEQQTQLERVKAEGLQTELKFLKAQYHPHFLFNALNTIYFQMDESVGEAKKTVEEFSALLRYQLYDQQQLVPIERELEHLQHFIHLQKARASERLQLEVCIDPALGSGKVYPLLLLPLVENAFKYAGGDYRLSIKAWKEEEWICFRVENSVPVQPAAQRVERGIGLENLQRRLELLYPGRHHLHLQQEDGMFTAHLKILAHP
jgi:two-component system, LytTR family, sensor kinase